MAGLLAWALRPAKEERLPGGDRRAFACRADLDAFRAGGEAGVRGKIGAKSIGVFSYEKRMEESGVVTPCEVRVFPMVVKRQLEAWPEAHQREARWFEARDAVAAVKIDGLRELIEFFLKKRVKKSVAKETRAKASSKAKAPR